jgi:DnaD/phage-associated family protein
MKRTIQRFRGGRGIIMKELKLTKYVQTNATVLDNEFIDHYMVRANGEYVKVYLLLLRHMNQSSGYLSVSELADLLECTEKDILRALRYWKSEGLLDYLDDTPDDPSPKSTAPSPAASSGLHDVQSGYMTSSIPADSVSDSAALASTTNIQQYRSRKERAEFKELLFVAEQYLGKTLSATDIDQITYFYDTLNMSAELIEYLIEYCVENGHKSMHYINKVALSWHEENITTVNLAKTSSFLYNKNCYCVLNAYGIKGRGPAASEIAYIRKWSEEYGFALEVILEACDRTMNSIHQPSFDYTDSILKRWKDKNVRQLKDIDAVDADYRKEKERAKELAKERKRQQQTQKPVNSQNNKFNNFDGRSYDMNDLERRLVQQ